MNPEIEKAIDEFEQAIVMRSFDTFNNYEIAQKRVESKRERLIELIKKEVKE